MTRRRVVPRIVSGTLYQGDVGATNVHLSVTYDPNSGITISGSDSGSSAQKVFGAAEYEYWRSVEPKHVDRVYSALVAQSGGRKARFSGERLIELICDRFGGDYEAEKRFREWCETKGIPTTFRTWSSGSG